MDESNKIQLPRCYSCNSCGYRSSAYKAVCPICRSTDMVALEGAKGGIVVDFVQVSIPPENLKDLGEYVSVLVKLDNGCQIFGIILEDPKNIKIGTSVVVSSFNNDTKEVFFKTL